MENSENLISSNNATISQLKCNNCGSSHFSLNGDDTYVCNYCNSTIRIKDNIQDKFVSFFKPTTKETKNVYAVKPLVSKNQFHKDAIMYLGMMPNVPEDILSSSFDKVKQTLSYYISFNVEFTVISISTQMATMSGSYSQETEVEKSSSFTCCGRISGANAEYEKAMLRSVLPAGEIYSNKIPKNVIDNMGKDFPSKEKIKETIEREINDLKAKIMSENGYPRNTKLVHNITNSAVYIVPEYSLDYTYDGEKYTLHSISCEHELYGAVPQSKSSTLDKELNKQAKKVFAFPTLLSVASIIFFIIGLLSFRNWRLIVATAIIMLANVAVFLVANAFQKPIVIRQKTKYFEKRKQKVETFIQENKLPELDYEDESTLGQYMRWY